MADDDLTPNELALAMILEMQRINENLESLTNSVYSLPEQFKNILNKSEVMEIVNDAINNIRK